MTKHDDQLDHALINAGLPEGDPLRIIVERVMAVVEAQDIRNQQTMRVVNEVVAATVAATQQLNAAISSGLASDLRDIRRHILCIDLVLLETASEVFKRHHTSIINDRKPWQ